MTDIEIEREIARLAQENARMRGKVKIKAPSNKLEPEGSVLYRMTMKHPGFAAFCRPRLGSSILPMSEIIAKYRKARAAELKNFMKPKGINSILKGGPYTTGRYCELVDTEKKKKAWIDDPEDPTGPQIWGETAEPLVIGPFEERARLIKDRTNGGWTSIFTDGSEPSPTQIKRDVPQNLLPFGQDPVIEPEVEVEEDDPESEEDPMEEIPAGLILALQEQNRLLQVMLKAAQA